MWRSKRDLLLKKGLKITRWEGMSRICKKVVYLKQSDEIIA